MVYRFFYQWSNSFYYIYRQNYDSEEVAKFKKYQQRIKITQNEMDNQQTASAYQGALLLLYGR